MKSKGLNIKSATCLVLLIFDLSCKNKESPTPSAHCYICPIPDDTSHFLPVYTKLQGSLPTQSLDTSKKYLIVGTVFIEANSVLTIPAGTKLFGDKVSKGVLVVKPGGKLIAEGTACNPIIFTSNQVPGAREQSDWGGIILLGRTNINQDNPKVEGLKPETHYGSFGNSNYDNENSGILKYVRIEYAGIALTPNNEINGLTMGAVGNGTIIDYIQATYSGGDSYAWFGGTVNCSHIIAFASWDDDFDTDMGYSGKVQYAIGIRDPYNADISGSNGFESDNNSTGDGATPKTAAVFSNITILGPIYDSAKATFSGYYQNAIHLKNNTEQSIFNSVIAGFPIGVNLDGTLLNYTSGKGVLDNNILVCPAAKGKSSRAFFNGATSDNNVADYWKINSNKAFTLNQPQALYGTFKYSGALANAGIEPTLIMGFNTTAGVSGGTYPANPNLALFSGPTQSGAAFTDAKLTVWFITTTTFRGAFGNNDWTDCWSNFNTQNVVY